MLIAHFEDAGLYLSAGLETGSSAPVKNVRSCPAMRLQAVPCTRAMKGNGIPAPTMAEVPVKMVPTLPAAFACLTSQIVASELVSFFHQTNPMQPAAPGAPPQALLPPPSALR